MWKGNREHTLVALLRMQESSCCRTNSIVERWQPLRSKNKIKASSEKELTGSKKVKLFPGDKVYILNIQGRKVSNGEFLQRGSQENGHTDIKKSYCIKDLKDNSIKWLGRSDIHKIPSSNWE